VREVVKSNHFKINVDILGAPEIQDLYILVCFLFCKYQLNLQTRMSCLLLTCSEDRLVALLYQYKLQRIYKVNITWWTNTSSLVSFLWNKKGITF